jgi:hypothetical protein
MEPTGKVVTRKRLIVGWRQVAVRRTTETRSRRRTPPPPPISGR